MQPINMDNNFSRDILISAMESILENPSLANMNEQLSRLTDIENLHLKKLIDIQVSIKSLEGIANSPLLVLSTVIDEIIVVSRSLDVIISFELSSWNKKWSRIGIVLEEFITPPRSWSFFCNELLETINFIGFMIYLQIYHNGKILINKLINIGLSNY